VQVVMLRSQTQAVYSPDNIGHFALAYPAYAHFTSPIRRYPDLMVHRLIKQVLASKGKPVTDTDYNQVKIQCEHCSMTGRRADEANWDVIKWLKTEYMMDKVGEEYDGIVSGVTSFGLFVELKQTYVEGLVHVTELGNDYYHYDPSKHRMVGERTRQTFRLGDEIRIRVMRVDLDEARIDFELLESLSHHRGERVKNIKSGKPARKSKGVLRRKKRSSKKSVNKSERKTGGKKSKKKSRNKRGKRGQR